jgi:hypothetical protein
MDTIETSCRSEVGVTVGLIDAMISIARVLARRPIDGPTVRAALTDLASDEDVRAIMRAGAGQKSEEAHAHE